VNGGLNKLSTNESSASSLRDSPVISNGTRSPLAPAGRRAPPVAPSRWSWRSALSPVNGVSRFSRTSLGILSVMRSRSRLQEKVRSAICLLRKSTFWFCASRLKPSSVFWSRAIAARWISIPASLWAICFRLSAERAR